LTWTSTNATAATIAPGIGSVAVNGSRSVSLTQTSTFTLTLTGPGGTTTYAATVVVPPNLPVPSIPSFIFPESGATDQPTTIAFVWRKTTGATNYHLQVALDSLFGSRLVNDSTLTDTLKEVTGLLEGSRYYRRVRAGNTSGWSAFSASAHFTTLTTVSKTPEPPAFIAPSSGTVVPPDSVMVKWTNVQGSKGYHLQVSCDSTFAATILSDSSLTDTVRVISGLTPGTVSFSRVRAKNAVGWGTYSALDRFNVATQTLAAPKLISPSNGASQQPLSLLLSWNASPGSTGYDLEVALDQGFTKRILLDSNLTTTSRTVGPLHRKTRYFWRVRARDSQLTSAFCSSWMFRTVISAPKSPWTLYVAPVIAPSPRSLVLSWSEGEDADQYRVQVSEDLQFTRPVVDTTCTDSSLTVYQIVPERDYYARVRSENVAGVSEFSTLLMFSVNDAGVRTTRELADFQLCQNYPNPFNPSTTIEFVVPVQSEVSVRIYDVLGTEVVSLLTEAVSAGRHSVVWNAAGASSGTYFCRFTAGSYIEVRRLLLIK
jgi:hypothetical protein